MQSDDLNGPKEISIKAEEKKIITYTIIYTIIIYMLLYKVVM